MNFTTLIPAAGIFIIWVALMDFFLVALVNKKSLTMFARLIGSGIPFALILTAASRTGLFVQRSLRRQGEP